MVSRYEWSTRFIQCDPDATGRLFERLRKANGGKLHPEVVVKAGRPKSAPHHEEFIWDDKLAAKEQRLDVARKLERSIRVVEIERGEVVDSKRVYVNVRHEGESFYTTVNAAMVNKDYKVYVQNEVVAFLDETLSRCEELASRTKHLGPVMTAVRKALARMSKQ